LHANLFRGDLFQICSVALNRQINKQRYANTINLICACNNVFAKYQAQGEVLIPTPPCLRPCGGHRPNHPPWIRPCSRLAYRCSTLWPRSMRLFFIFVASIDSVVFRVRLEDVHCGSIEVVFCQV